MKKYCIILSLMLLTGCGVQEGATGDGTTSATTATEEVQERTQGSGVAEDTQAKVPQDREFFVQSLGYMEQSRIIDSTGKTLIPYSNTGKGIVTDIRGNKAVYLYSTDYEYLGRGENEWDIDFNPGVTLYDLQGEELYHLECSQIKYCLGDYYLDDINDSLVSMATGEVAMEGVAGMEPRGDAVVFYDKEYNPLFITDHDLNILCELEDRYDYLYYSDTYIEKDYILAYSWKSDSTVIDVIDSYGNNLLGRSFEEVGYAEDDYLVMIADGISYVYNSQLELILEYEGTVLVINENCYLTKTPEEEYRLYSSEGEVLYESSEYMSCLSYVPGGEIFTKEKLINYGSYPCLTGVSLWGKYPATGGYRTVCNRGNIRACHRGTDRGTDRGTGGFK